jgi:hypothetical protein
VQKVTALDEIQKASLELTAVLSKERVPSREEVLQVLEKLREKIFAFIAHARALYDSAILVTSNFKSPGVAAESWEDLHENFAAARDVFERLPMLEPRTDSVIKHAISVLRLTADAAEEKYHSYAGLAELENCDAIAREGFALLDAEETSLER